MSSVNSRAPELCDEICKNVDMDVCFTGCNTCDIFWRGPVWITIPWETVPSLRRRCSHPRNGSGRGNCSATWADPSPRVSSEVEVVSRRPLRVWKRRRAAMIIIMALISWYVLLHLQLLTSLRHEFVSTSHFKTVSSNQVTLQIDRSLQANLKGWCQSET